MKYKLYVQDITESSSFIWRLADMGDDVPAMNYQVNSIAELKDRQCDYSQSLKLPQTPNNCKLFGYSHQFDVISEATYRRFNCRLFCDDSIIAGKGSYLTIDKISDSFEVQILSGNADLFDTLSEKKVSELDLGYWQIGSGDFGTTNSNYVIPKLNLVSGEATWVDTTIDLALPFAWLKNAIEKIITTSGYTLQTNLANSDWNKKALNVCTYNPTSGSFTPFNCTFFQNFIPAGTGKADIIINENQANNASVSDKTLVVALNSNTEVKVNYTLNVGAGTTGSVKIEVSTFSSEYGITVIDESTFNISSLPQTKELTFNMSGDGNLAVYVSMYYYDIPAILDSYLTGSVEFTPNSESKLLNKANLYVAPNLGFDTQFDLLKAFAQLYGLTFVVDNDNKIVYAYTMKKLYDNKPIAKDLSGKVEDKDNDKTYSLSGYAQKNIIKFKDNSKESITDTVSFNIDNQTIEKEKELFTIGFEAGNNYRQKYLTSPLTVAYVPAWEKELDDEDNITFNFSGVNQRIFFINDIGLVTTAQHIPVGDFIQYYNELKNKMLVNARMVEEDVYLTEQDIEEYKSSIMIPVYISKYGAYFYINKIKNFVSGKLTKCELIKI